MLKYAQKDDKKVKSHQNKSNNGKQAPSSSGNSTGASANEAEFSKPKQAALRQSNSAAGHNLESDLNDFSQREKIVKSVSEVEKIFGTDASFHEVGKNTKIYKLRSHGFFGNTGHYSGVQTANNIVTLLGEKPIIRLELESCYGGFGGKYSNAQIIANELNIRVKAYKWKVSAHSKQKNPNNYVSKEPMGNDAEKAGMISGNKLMFEVGEKILRVKRVYNSLNRHLSRRDDVDTKLENTAKT